MWTERTEVFRNNDVFLHGGRCCTASVVPAVQLIALLKLNVAFYLTEMTQTRASYISVIIEIKTKQKNLEILNFVS